jgi:hypothetical protein
MDGTTRARTPRGERCAGDPEVTQSVIASQPIARVTAWKSGPSHAHIEVCKTLNGGCRVTNMIDPMRYFK